MLFRAIEKSQKLIAIIIFVILLITWLGGGFSKFPRLLELMTVLVPLVFGFEILIVLWHKAQVGRVLSNFDTQSKEPSAIVLLYAAGGGALYLGDIFDTIRPLLGVSLMAWAILRYLQLISSSFALTERGIYYEYRLLPWEHIQAHTWQDGLSGKCTLSVQVSEGRQASVTTRLAVPVGCRLEVETMLRNRVAANRG